jgi:hypothetical protein
MAERGFRRNILPPIPAGDAAWGTNRAPAPFDAVARAVGSASSTDSRRREQGAEK